jgi:type I restriction enzyme R subunit
LSRGILEAIDLESYRLEKKNEVAIVLENADGKVEAPSTGIAGAAEPEIDTLDNIISSFNDISGNIAWEDKDNVAKQINAIPEMVIRDEKFRNAYKNADEQNIRIEYLRALSDVMLTIMSDNMELYKQFNDNWLFKKWLSDSVFRLIEERLQK